MTGISISLGNEPSNCEALVARLNGPESDSVSETVFDWLSVVMQDSCGLSIKLHENIVSENGFIDFNSLAIDRGAFAMVTGYHEICGDSVMLYLVLDQIFTNPYLMEDRKHFSRPDEGMLFDMELLGSSSNPPEFMIFHGYLLASMAYGKMEMYDRALTEVDLALQNSFGVPAEAMAEAYLFRSQLVMTISGDITSGIADLDMALEIDPHCIRARIGKGYCFELTGNVRAALEQYNIAVDTAPDMYKCWKARANLHSILGMFEESIADYTMAVQLNPDDFESWHYGGVDFRRIRDFQTAYEWLTRALELEPDAAQVWYDRALVNVISEEDMEKAIEDLERALELNGTDWKWYDTAARVYTVRNQWEQCIEIANRGLEVSPIEPQLLIDRSAAYMMLKDIDSALDDLERAVAIGRSRPDITPTDAMYTTLEALRAVSAIPTESPDYWLYLGYAYGESGFYEEAIDPISRSIQMSPSRDAYWLRASNLAETGNIEQALEDLQKALDMTVDPAKRTELQEAIRLLAE